MLPLKKRKIIKNIIVLFRLNLIFFFFKFFLLKNFRISIQSKLFFYYFFKKSFSTSRFKLMCYQTGHSRAVLKDSLLNRLTFTNLSKQYKLCFHQIASW